MTEKQKRSDPTKPAKAGETRGQTIVQPMVGDLQREFPGVGGFSASNPRRMKNFFENYRGIKKLAPLVREIRWSHNLNILEQCSDLLEREFSTPQSRTNSEDNGGWGMKTSETACFIICARAACIINGLINLNAETAQ